MLSLFFHIKIYKKNTKEKAIAEPSQTTKLVAIGLARGLSCYQSRNATESK